MRGKLFKLFQLSRKPSKIYYSYLEFNANYEFVDRSKGSDKLVYIMGGYEEYLWERIFPRIEKNVPEDYDVCILSTGIDRDQLRKRAEENNWSYLTTVGGRVGPDQNLVVKEHPEADYIFKLDEDIFIGHNYFENVMEAYKKADDSARFEPGFVAPVINLNNSSYGYFLEQKDSVEEFKEKFGELDIGSRGSKVFHDPEIAKYIWEKTLPLDETVSLFQKNDEMYRPILGKFNIGAIMFKREFWKELLPFKATMDDQLAEDENQIMRKSREYGKVPILATKAFAGHFAFGTQKEEMREFWTERVGDLD